MVIRVAVTDDHPMVIAGLQHVIDTTTHIKMVQSYVSGVELLEGLKKEQPDVLLLDLQLPDIPGEKLAAEILNLYPNIRIVILTSLEAMECIDEMMQLGCMGYLLKNNTDYSRLIRAVELAWNGECFLDESLNRHILSNIIKKRKQSEALASMLTRREKDVLRLITEELTNQEIADRLSVSVRTVECHRLSLQHKLRVKNTAGLVKRAIEMRLMS